MDVLLQALLVCIMEPTETYVQIASSKSIDRSGCRDALGSSARQLWTCQLRFCPSLERYLSTIFFALKALLLCATKLGVAREKRFVRECLKVCCQTGTCQRFSEKKYHSKFASNSQYSSFKGSIILNI